MENEYNIEEPHYLLDSNIVSEIIKPLPDFNVIKKLVEHSSDCAIGSPSWHELLFGMYKMPEGMNKKSLEKTCGQDVSSRLVYDRIKRAVLYCARGLRTL